MSSTNPSPSDEFDALRASFLENTTYSDTQRSVCSVILDTIRPAFVGDLASEPKTSPSISIRIPRRFGMTTVYRDIIAALLRSSRSLRMMFVSPGIRARDDFKSNLFKLLDFQFPESNTLEVQGNSILFMTSANTGYRGIRIPNIIFMDHYDLCENVLRDFVPMMYPTPHPVLIFSSAEEHKDDAFNRAATKHDFALAQTVSVN